MKAFMDEDFLLDNETARVLYHDYAATMPIIDYHCHVSPMEIAQDRRFENITQIWLGGDHYKWRLLRAYGVDEDLITGESSSDYEKFKAFAQVIPKTVGNPVYHWAHLELKRYFNCDLPLSPDTADEIWNNCHKRLAQEDMSVRGIITCSHVKVIATTDDPTDDLVWHKAIADDASFPTLVVPTFRPDNAMNVEKPGFIRYIEKLAESAGITIHDLDGLYAALENRLVFFHSMGCRASDHGLDDVPYNENAEAEATKAFKKALEGGILTAAEAGYYKAALMLFLGRQYARFGWVMQIHYGAMRNINTTMFRRLGADTGFDAIGGLDCSRSIASFLDHLDKSGELPKTILYSMNPNDDAMLVSIAGCFSGVGITNKVQHGSAWWFNDSKHGIESQLTSLASRGLLGGFVGMLTDSRSFLSYTRHEYFRRLLCNLVGGWVESGEYPHDLGVLGGIIQDISYRNAAGYFGIGETAL